MSSRLILQFLGLPQVYLDDKPVSTDRRKAIALLAYLAVNDVGKAHQKYSRESLSALFWPDYKQAKAFSNLRRTIWEVHQAIGAGWLIAERESVHLTADVDRSTSLGQRIDLDVARFQDLLSQGHQQSDSSLRIPLLVESMKLYRDHFMTGFSLRDAPNFNEWALAEAEDLRRKLAEALTMLLEDYCVLGEADQAIPYARRLVTLDPLNESAHRQLMEVYLQAGQHSAALKQYQTCEQILRKELNLDPQPETLALYKKIRKGEMKPAQIKEQIETIAPQKGAEMPLPTGTVTFLLTDIEGSTNLAQQYPDALPALLARHHEILNQSIQAHNGYAFQIVGDSFCAAFHSASDAVNAALDAQRLFHNEAWTPVPIKVRMGIHTGAAKLQDASKALRYSGYAAIALTQRIMSVGHGGQVLVSQAAQDLIRGMLPTDIKLRDMGNHRFKDFAQTERIYQMVVPGLVNDFPPLQTFDAFPNNLPMQLTSFMGREKEQAEIANLIVKQRLVSLTGAGGIGKTRLSIQAGFALLNEFPNGTWLVELAPLSDSALLPQVIVNTLGLIEQANRPPQTILTDFLQKKRALLILDNCEHLIQACAQLAETLLHTCPDLHILATSRETLGVAGETVYLIPTLTTPDPLHTTVDTLSNYEASQLFVERAQSVLMNFSMTRDNALAIAQICHNLDGIPLAIELAAARVKGLSVEQIASRLNDRFRLLTGGSRTALPRHQTLQALIDWSYNLLSGPERVLLRRLSIFAGGWTLEATESVCAGDGLESDQILDLLLRLVDKSLIIAKTQGTEPRYHMLETIRQYARERLRAAGEGETVCQRHLTYFVDLAERAEPNLRAFDMVIWLDRLEAEHDNLRVVLEWALESDIEAQLSLASALLWFWWIRGHKDEGIEWLERGLSIEAAERRNQHLTPSRAKIRGKALNASGFLMSWALETGKAEARLEESMALFRELGPAGKQGTAYALLRLGQLPSNSNRVENLVEQSLAVFREMEDKFGIAECLRYLSYGTVQTNDNFQLFVEEYLALSREIGDEDGIAGALEGLAELALMQDNYQRAIALYEESLAGYHAVGNKVWFGVILSNLGRIARMLGDYGLAARQLAEALTILQHFGMKRDIAITLRRLGQLDLTLGDYGQAAQKYEQALALFRETESEDGIATALYALGEAAWVQGNYEQAGRRYEEVLVLGREMENKSTIAYALYGLGKVAQAKGDYALARSSHVEALTIRRGMDNRRAIAYSLDALAVLAATEQKSELAVRLFGAAEDLQMLIHFTISPRERAEHDQALAAARATLGEETFVAAYEEGQKMTLDEAVAYALQEN